MMPGCFCYENAGRMSLLFLWGRQWGRLLFFMEET
nr:MAG TPA: hypothetical protein [Caudoviricetes sp.]